MGDLSDLTNLAPTDENDEEPPFLGRLVASSCSGAQTSTMRGLEEASRAPSKSA